MSDLKPCPFCGSDNLRIFADAIDVEFNTKSVICGKCCAKAPLHNWNARAESQELATLHQQNAELVELAKYCAGFLGSSDALDSMALHSITHRAHELISKIKGDKDAIR
jgi:hypothetical protein